MSRTASTTISATATVRVRGFDSPAHASTVAHILGRALGGALSAATETDERPKRKAASRSTEGR